MKSTPFSYLFFALVISSVSWVSSTPLKVGFYRSTCPSAESIVRKAVSTFISSDVGLAAGLIRLHYHDCFVRGCDASILLDSTPSSLAEKDHPSNNPSLTGFEVINQVKAQIEAQCPQVVSCADILAFAARDSAYKVGGIKYDVPSGRRDGRISLKTDVSANLPSAYFNAKQLSDNFAKKGLSVDEMVTLSGAHSIGDSHCSSFSKRLYYFNATHPQDPSMDPQYAVFLKTRCPPSSTTDPIAPLDAVTPNRLDNTYYKELKNHRGLLFSDQTLFNSPATIGMVKSNILHPSRWSAKFASAMVHMGFVDILTGNQGEIRRNCSVVN
ncbi:peroxidase [Ranunculus cassubicifolius]